MTPTLTAIRRDGERGSALILALLVALVLAFLGLGLLLQTSLGLQAAGTDRWVTKSMHAAEAGLMMQIQMIKQEQLGAPGVFQLEDDPGFLDATLLRGSYQVAISNFCEVEPAETVDGYQADQDHDFRRRFFHARSVANRNVGNLVGLTQAEVEADISIWPFDMTFFTPITMCN